MVSNQPARRRTRVREVEPEDARRGPVAPLPADAREMQADRAIADAERARVEGTASAEQVRHLAAVDGVRTPEDRRCRWPAESR